MKDVSAKSERKMLDEISRTLNAALSGSGIFDRKPPKKKRSATAKVSRKNAAKSADQPTLF